MSELALYRKYRSQSFDQVVGQPHVVTTLINALKNQRVSHAYLLTGPRGVGKTSVARLLARAVNCQATDVTPPCSVCEICLIPLASNMDIIEIDAASNRKIDEIRDLRDKINLSPARSRYKVYIIDEVHMLTTEAFNALLKTLEEPPAHAIFILATTEVHKLPDTIISRTQRFNFKAITQSELENHLSKIAAQEKISIEPAALAMIAEASRGSFRDAISLLDQVAINGSVITPASISTILGLSDASAVKALVKAISHQGPKEAIQIIDQLTAQGVQTGQLVNQLVNHLRTMMLATISVADQQPDSPTGTELAHMINSFSKVLLSPLPEITLEITIVELSLKTAASQSPVANPAKPAVSSAAKVTNSTPTQNSQHTTHNSAPTEKSPTADTPVSQPSNTKSQLTTEDLWPKALVLIKSQNNSLYALLSSCLVQLTDTDIIITCRFNFHRDRLQEAKNREIIETALAKVFGRTIHASAQLETVKSAPKAIDPSAELVSSALKIFGGEVVDD